MYKRIVTHTDLDGISCAVMLKKIFNVSEITFIEPSDIQKGRFFAEPTDIIADLPLPAEGCALWFDHHSKTETPQSEAYNLDATQPSCAGYIYRIYKDKKDLSKFEDFIKEVDKIDSAQYTREDVINPPPAEQISMALCRNREDFEFMKELVDLLCVLPYEEVAQHPLVQQRFLEELEQQESFLERAKQYLTVHGNTVVGDFRECEEKISGNNPFRIYIEYPEADFYINIRYETQHPNICRISIYSSVWRKETDFHIGNALAKYGGGGHKGAGGCGVPREESEKVFRDLLRQCNSAK